jgi:hypothetical protein
MIESHDVRIGVGGEVRRKRAARRKIVSAVDQILTTPSLRTRLIAHAPVIDDLGNVDYHAGRELNPYSRDIDNPFPDGGMAPLRVP